MRLQLVLATRLTLRRARLVRDAIAISLLLFRTSRTLSFPHSFAALRRGQATTVSRCSSATSDEDADREDTLISQFAPQTAGFVLASSRLSEERIMAHFARRPIVLINRDIARLPRVLIDGARGVEAAVDHLAVLGHRRIAYISGPAGSWSNRATSPGDPRGNPSARNGSCSLSSRERQHMKLGRRRRIRYARARPPRLSPSMT